MRAAAIKSPLKRAKLLPTLCAIPLLVSAASAQTISYGDAMQTLINACGPDVQAQCADVRIGSGRVESCLAKNANKLSPTCINTYNQVIASLQTRAAAQEAVPNVCAGDAKVVCSDFREGRARILRCLTRRDNVRKLSRACNKAIDDAGWR